MTRILTAQCHINSPSDLFPKNCECWYHIVVTNVNTKTDGFYKGFLCECGEGTFAMRGGEENFWSLSIKRDSERKTV